MEAVAQLEDSAQQYAPRWVSAAPGVCCLRRTQGVSHPEDVLGGSGEVGAPGALRCPELLQMVAEGHQLPDEGAGGPEAVGPARGVDDRVGLVERPVVRPDTIVP